MVETKIKEINTVFILYLLNIHSESDKVFLLKYFQIR